MHAGTRARPTAASGTWDLLPPPLDGPARSRASKHSPRSSVLVATKVAGPSGQMEWIRGGPLRVDARNIRSAIEGSLRRLGTDYIDLFQIHWPDRCEHPQACGAGPRGARACRWHI